MTLIRPYFDKEFRLKEFSHGAKEGMMMHINFQYFYYSFSAQLNDYLCRLIQLRIEKYKTYVMERRDDFNYGPDRLAGLKALDPNHCI